MVHTWCTQKCLQKRVCGHCMVCKESLVSLCGPHTESAFTARSARRVWNHSALCKQSLVSLHGLQLESCMTAVCEKSLLSRYGLQQESDINVASGTSVRSATSVWHHSTVCNECLASQPSLQTKSAISAVSAMGKSGITVWSATRAWLLRCSLQEAERLHCNRQAFGHRGVVVLGWV